MPPGICSPSIRFSYDVPDEGILGLGVAGAVLSVLLRELALKISVSTSIVCMAAHVIPEEKIGLLCERAGATNMDMGACGHSELYSSMVIALASSCI